MVKGVPEPIYCRRTHLLSNEIYEKMGLRNKGGVITKCPDVGREVWRLDIPHWPGEETPKEIRERRPAEIGFESFRGRNAGGVGELTQKTSERDGQVPFGQRIEVIDLP
ncbi:hypothetical protein TNCV_4200021 [Trichonephila clavipes]|uniref:Uncharacterized protein n=1 Tax=Trichonephila clavipes TaxID=2585209 RepID=A0A8X6WCQ6_TRICX|nr:hypothetical protein TNCV_4200021 [Trichonephila clavipes]